MGTPTLTIQRERRKLRKMAETSSTQICQLRPEIGNKNPAEEFSLTDEQIVRRISNLFSFLKDIEDEQNSQVQDSNSFLKDIEDEQNSQVQDSNSSSDQV